VPKLLTFERPSTAQRRNFETNSTNYPVTPRAGAKRSERSDAA